MHWLLDAQALAFITVANAAPVAATRVVHHRWAFPLDAHLRWWDGRPVLGASKTIRGIAASILTTTAAAPLAGWPAALGALTAAWAMIGDIGSSFVKRRLGLPAESRVTGLDQVPESLLPLLALGRYLPLSSSDVALVVAVFFLGEVIGSRWLYRLHLRDRPY